MTSHTRRRDDRSAPPTEPVKQWFPTDKYPLDYDPDRRRNRSATLPSQSYDPKSHPSHDPRYNDPRLPSRSHRQDPHYPPPASYSYQHPSAPTPATSKAYQHATRPSAQHSSSSHHYPQPSSYQPSHPTPAYQVASSSRRQHPEALDTKTSRRPPPTANQPPYDQLYPPSDMPRSSARPSRALQPSYSAPANQAFWLPQPEPSSSRRPKDAYRERGRDQDRERERDRDKPVVEVDRYKDKARADRYRERERERDRPTPEVRYQESSRPRRKDSEADAVLFAEQRNAPKAPLSGKEAYSAPVRESSNGHRRHRTEDGTASTSRRHQPETTQNPITTMASHSTSVPQPDVQQTGEPPPAPRVMPVYLPPKAKSHRSHREARPSTAQGAQSGSDTERVAGKHRMERTPSGPAVQRSDAHTSTSARDRGNHDLQMGSRDDVRRAEGKYGTHPDTRQPLVQNNVDIPLVTPGFSSSALPTESKAPITQQIVSIRAGQGPSDPHDVYYKPSAISHSDAPQEVPSASILKSSGHTRSYSYETRAQSDRHPAVAENSRTDHGDDLPAGQRVSMHESSRALPTPISKPSYSRGNPEIGVDITSSSYPHSRPPSRSAHRTSANNAVPPTVAGPRLRSVSQGPQTNDPPTRPPSGTHHVSTTTAPNPSPSAHPTNGSPPGAGHAHSSQSSAQPSPKYAQLHGVSPSHSIYTQAPSTQPSVQPTPVISPQTLASSSRPSTRDGTNTDAPHTRQQSADQQRGTDNYPVKASWVVQTPATARRTKISREDKYLRGQQLNLETPQAQLRQVLSQDDDSIRRVSSSMMKASQATTPTRLSQRNSPGTKATDVSFGTPRGTSAGNSPKTGSAKEAPTPEHVSRQNPPPHLAVPPQIAVLDATPVSSLRDLPHGRVDHALLAPPFPAPARASRTTSSSQNQFAPSQSAVRNPSPTSYHPQLVPTVHAPSLFQPYQPPSPPMPDDSGQFSPPPLPIPPPGGFDDFPPLPIETRSSEIIPTRSNISGNTHDYPIPEVQSEMLHLPSQPFAQSQFSSMPPPRTTQPWESSKVDSNTNPIATSNGSVGASHGDARSSQPAFSQSDDVPIVHQEIIKSVPVVPSQSSTSRSRPKVTIEDVPEDSSPVLSKGNPTSAPIPPSASAPRSAPPSQNAAVPNVSPTYRSAGVDLPGHKVSPPSRSRDSLLQRNVEPIAMPSAPPMPPPTPTPASTFTRFPSSAPPTQPALSLSSQAPPSQRVTSHAVPSRTFQRAAELLPTSKLSASGSVNKSATAPVQATLNPVATAIDLHQPPNAVVNVPGPWVSRHVNIPTTSASHPSTAAASMTKHTAPISAPAPHTPGNTQPTTTADPSKHQSSRPGSSSIPPPDTTFTTVTSATTGKNAHSEQSFADYTRSRDATSTTTRTAPSQVYPTSARAGPSSATIPQTHVAPAQSSTHHRTVSIPIASSAAQKPPSPRKYPQHIPSTTVSVQPFPSRPPAIESQSVWASTPGHLSAPTPTKPGRLTPPDYVNDADMLNTPSSIAPSPMLNPGSVPQPLAVPTRTRKASTDSKDDKKKGIFGLFRTRTQSLKASDPLPTSSPPRASLDQGRAYPDASAAPPIAMPAPRGVTSTLTPKELHPPPVTSTSTRMATQSKFTSRVPYQITIPPPPTQTGREHREPTTNLFTPFKFLHGKRNRTVSAASLDVCDGNTVTATNTVVGSPDHSTVGQVQPLPGVILPGIRDPLVAASEWRDREEADRRERKINRIRRPGVTFDLDEEPPSPAPGTSSKRKKLVRRPTGRSSTPGPPPG